MLALAVTLLYGGSFVLFGGLVLFIAFRSDRQPEGQAAGLRQTFYLLALSLLLWQLTLLLEPRAVLPLWQLYLGRANFTAIVGTVYLALRFVRQVAGRELPRSLDRLLLTETALLAVLTMLTPLIDAGEGIDGVSGRPITHFGLLFPVYLLHILGYLGGALFGIARARRQKQVPATRKQLTLIGSGICATGGIALVSNALLPYAFGDFRFCDVGTLATLFFVLAVAYAVFVHGLFDLRIVIRETLVYGILLAFVLGGYSSAVFLITEYLTKGEDKLTHFAVLLIAFSFDPLRRFLEKKADQLLFGRISAKNTR
jgi:hypothetical protein